MLQASKQTILAIDFDHTIANIINFPHIDGLRSNAKFYINKLYDEGFYHIINTCRDCENEKQAIEFLKSEGVKFHLVNDNHPDLINFYGTNCRKICADFYIDDKNIDTLLNPDSHNWANIYQNIHKIVGADSYRSHLSCIPK